MGDGSLSQAPLLQAKGCVWGENHQATTWGVESSMFCLLFYNPYP